MFKLNTLLLFYYLGFEQTLFLSRPHDLEVTGVGGCGGWEEMGLSRAGVTKQGGRNEAPPDFLLAAFCLFSSQNLASLEFATFHQSHPQSTTQHALSFGRKSCSRSHCAKTLNIYLFRKTKSTIPLLVLSRHRAAIHRSGCISACLCPHARALSRRPQSKPSRTKAIYHQSSMDRVR